MGTVTGVWVGLAPGMRKEFVAEAKVLAVFI
jgi:hypothetical protein